MPTTVFAGWDVTMALTHPTGEVQYFHTSGAEKLNYRPGAGTLVAVAGGHCYKAPEDTESLKREYIYLGDIPVDVAIAP